MHPRAEAIVYSVERRDVSEFWLVDRDGSSQRTLLACVGMACLEPAWSPDGRLQAYEKREVQNGRRTLVLWACRIRLLDLEDWAERLLFNQDVPLYAQVRFCLAAFFT